MALPTYTRRERKPAREQLPKDAYVVKIIDAKLRTWPSGGEYIEIGFDIAEGPYAGFYSKQYQEAKKSGENAVWPYDARFNLNVPTDKSKDWEWNKYNEFFTQIEDDNNGFRFNNDLTSLRGKLFGGKFRIKQSKGRDGHIFDNTQLWWTCNIYEVREGKAAKSLPNDYLLDDKPSRPSADPAIDGFMSIPMLEGEEEVPFL